LIIMAENEQQPPVENAEEIETFESVGAGVS
jgi:hypothetical protein